MVHRVERARGTGGEGALPLARVAEVRLTLRDVVAHHDQRAALGFAGGLEAPFKLSRDNNKTKTLP